MRLIQKAVDCLKAGGVIIYPTDTIYGLGCDINQKKAVEKICKLKGIVADKAQLSCICEDMKQVGNYVIQEDTGIYKMMKSVLPGPYTFILKASKEVPRHFQSRRKTVGIRIPDHQVSKEIVRLLGGPLYTASLPLSDEDGVLYEPEEIYENFGHAVDMILESGPCGQIPSTVVDCSEGENAVEVIREGLGPIDALDIV